MIILMRNVYTVKKINTDVKAKKKLPMMKNHKENKFTVLTWGEIRRKKV